MNNIKTNALFFALLALIFIAYGALYLLTPEDLVQALIQFYKLDSDKGTILKAYIHTQTWLKFKFALVVVFIVLLYFFYYDRNVVKEYKLSIGSFLNSIKSDWLIFSFWERITLFSIIGVFAISLIYYSSITPIQLDELHTWLFFIDRGPFVTAAYYPASNNHIAYNLLSIPWTICLPPVWALRVVSLIAAVGIMPLWVVILKRRYSFSLSIVGMLLLMTSACFSWYAVQGRGYVLELFFLVLVLYIIIQSQTIFTDRLLILFNALAVYCVPVAVIPLALLNGYYFYLLILSGDPHFKRIIRIVLYSIGLIFLCYLPVGVFTGFEQLINNPFVQRVSYHDACVVGSTVYLPSIWNFISGSDGTASWILLLVLLVGLVVSFLQGNKFVWMPFMVLLLPFILLQVYPVLLFERTWLWLVIPFVWCCVEMIYNFFHVRWSYTAIVAVVFISTLLVLNLRRSYTTNQLLVRNAQQFASLKQALDVRLSGKTIGVYDDVLYDYLLFYQGEQKRYELIYLIAQPAAKPYALLKKRKDFSPSEGCIIWFDSVYVAYKPE